jgi:hypothetical protein
MVSKVPVKLKIPNSSKTQPPKASLITLSRELLLMIMKAGQSFFSFHGSGEQDFLPNS